MQQQRTHELTSSLKKIVYFDRETINNALQRENRGAVQKINSQSSSTVLDGDINAESRFSASLGVPFVGRLKFLFSGKIELQYLREWDSRTTVTSTDISMFRTIESNLTQFNKVQLHDVKNSLTSFRVAATFLKLVKSNNQDFNIREAADLLCSMEGYDLYDIGDNRYVRFNQKAYLSNYKRNDISMSVLDLYCIRIGDYPLDSFDYLKKLNSMQSLFDVPAIQGKTLEDIYFSNNSSETEQQPNIGSGQNDRLIKLYDVLCAYVSEQ